MAPGNEFHILKFPAFLALYPGGATFNIVGPKNPADLHNCVPSNIENGTSAARGLSTRLPSMVVARGTPAGPEY